MGPLLPPFLSFATGIAAGPSLALGYAASIGGVALSLCFVMVLYLRRLRFTPFILVPLFFFLGSLYIIPYSAIEVPSDHILNTIRQDQYSQRAGIGIEGVVDQVESTGRRTRVWLDVDGVNGADGLKSASGKVLLTVNARTELLPGDRVRAHAMLGEPRAFGNPGEFDYRDWLKRRGVLVTGYVKSARLIEKTPGEGGLRAGVQRARSAIARFIDASGAEYPEPLKALVISGQGGIDRALREAFAATGTAHILSISGLHVGMLAAFSYWLALFVLKRSERVLLAIDARKTALVISAVPAIAYSVLAGLPVPTQRSVVMVLAFIVSFAAGRGKDHLNTLSLAGLIVLAIFPASVWEASFQLSFVAMASIIVLLPRLEELSIRVFGGPPADKEESVKGAATGFLRRKVLPLFLVTVAAGLGTSPILAYHFHRVALTGLFANLAAVPLAGVAVPFLLVSSMLLPVSETLAWVALFPADMAFGFMAAVVDFFASFPYASLWVAPPGLVEVGLYYALIFSVLNLRRGRSYAYAAVFSVALLFALPLGRNLAKGPSTLRVTFLSVGQGDSAFIEFPDGATMLIDGGGSNNPDFDTGERVVAPFLRSKGVRRIDYMVLSHAQQDHMGGLLFLARNMEVGEFWWNGSGELGPLGAALDEKGAVKRVVGASTPKAAVEGALIEFLNPPEGGGFDTNDSSLVLKVAYGERSFLFTGDIGERAEKLLASRGVHADVLKAPHHGSRYSSSAEFLKAASPSVVVISSGFLNSFGFPHAEALERYNEAGAVVMRTDTSGAIMMETDGRTLMKKGYLTGGGL